MKSVIILMLCLLGVTYGYMMIELVEAKGKCVSKTYDLGVLKLGQIVDVKGHCMEATCMNGQISYKGCGKASPPPGTHFLPPDMTKPYPECCAYNNIVKDKH